MGVNLRRNGIRRTCQSRLTPAGGGELALTFRERVGQLQGPTRRIAIVAMARKLLIALWRYVETGVVPAGIALRSDCGATA